MSEAARKWISPEEYLALEEYADYKSEYFDGEIFAMSGATFAHNLISGNVAWELRNQLRDRGCKVVQSDQRVKIRETGLYTYPDVVVVCDEPEFEGSRHTELLNPSLIVEVLSESTEAYDRGEKFAQYRSLPSLLSYVLVASGRPGVECYSRSSGRDGWVFTACSDPDGALELPATGCKLTLREVYRNVTFPEAPPRRVRRERDVNEF